MTHDFDVYAWGDNKYYLAGGEKGITVTTPTKIIFDDNQDKKPIISKLFTGFSHCFAITTDSDLFGWGQLELYRLTSDYGKILQNHPKVIQYESCMNQAKNEEKDPEENNDEEKVESNVKAVDDRVEENKLLSIIYSKEKITSFNSVVVCHESN